MEILKLFSLVGALAAAFIILRKLIAEFSGPSRREEYRRLEEESAVRQEDNRKEYPRCPLCGGDTERHQYPT